MLTLISTLGGLIISGLPSVLEYFQKKSDNEYQLKFLKARYEHEEQLAAHGVDLSKITTDEYNSDDASAELFPEEGEKREVGPDFWSNNQITSLRTTVTYIFILELVLINVALTYWIFTHGIMIRTIHDLADVSDVIFSKDEMAMLGGIIGFWFGARNWDRER